VTFDPNQPASPEPTERSSPVPATSPAPAGTSNGAAFPNQPVAPGLPVVRAQPRKAGGMWLNVVLGLAALVAVGGIAFAIGRNTAPAAAGGGNFPGGNFPGGNFAPNASGGLGGNFPGGSLAPDASGGLGGAFTRGGGFNLSGTVESITGDTLTLKTANGQTLEFGLGADTTYASKTPATAADVKPGSKVEVQLQGIGNGQPQGSAAASGPIGTAGSVTIDPQ
jgi:hypothetical protein